MPSPLRSRLALGALTLGTLAAPLDSAVNIAFPSLSRAFGLGVEDIRWVVIAYVLTYSSLMLIFGKIGDLMGYRRVFQWGLAVSSAGFLACGLAETFTMLLLGRVLQGIGIALTLSCGPALATSLFHESERTRVLGIYAAVTAAGAALGPVIGGLLVEHFGWSAVFWARAPLTLVALPLSWLIPLVPRRPGSATFDAMGAALLVAWMSALLLGLALHSTRLGPALPLALTLAALAIFAWFLAHERRHPEPIIRPSLFADRTFLAVNLASIAVNFAAFSIMLLVPFYLARVAGLGAAEGGLVLALAAIGTVAGAWAGGRFGQRVGIARLCILGMVLSVAGLGGISLWRPVTGFGLMAASLLVQGVGVGFFQVAYADLVTAALPVEQRGVAGSLTMVTRTIGVVGAANGLAAAHHMLESAGLVAGSTADAAFLGAFQTTFLMTAAGLAAVLLLGLAGLAIRAVGVRPTADRP